MQFGGTQQLCREYPGFILKSAPLRREPNDSTSGQGSASGAPSRQGRATTVRRLSITTWPCAWSGIPLTDPCKRLACKTAVNSAEPVVPMNSFYVSPHLLLFQPYRESNMEWLSQEYSVDSAAVNANLTLSYDLFSFSMSYRGSQTNSRVCCLRKKG
jgi:hypothetical protein